MSLKINLPEQKEKKEFNKPKYVPNISGQKERIRLLQEDVVDVFKHFLPNQKISIICPGKDCPVCVRNNRLYKENPGMQSNQIKGLVPRLHRYMINVLNRTEVKVDKDGNVIYRNANGTFPPTSPYTGEIIATQKEQPLNEVQILERGIKLFNQFVEKDTEITTGEIIYKTSPTGELVIENGMPVIEKMPEPVGIMNYDLILNTSGVDQTKFTTVEARPELNDVVEVPAEKLYDLNSIGMRFTPAEIEKLIAGVPPRDIYEARKALNTVSSGETSAEAESRVASLFDDDEDDF